MYFRCFESFKLISRHVTDEHFKAILEPTIACQWLGCDTLARQRWSFMTHLQVGLHKDRKFRPVNDKFKNTFFIIRVFAQTRKTWKIGGIFPNFAFGHLAANVRVRCSDFSKLRVYAVYSNRNPPSLFGDYCEILRWRTLRKTLKRWWG